jgi:hypothetical protein
MARIDVQPRPDTGEWQWRVLDARGQLRLAGTHATREEALATGSFWVTQVQDPDL